MDKRDFNILHTAIIHAQEDICAIILETLAAACWIFKANIIVSIVISVYAILQRIYSFKFYYRYMVQLKDNENESDE